MARRKETISTINDLIETLKDGQEGFRQAAEAVENPELKSLFNECSLQRARFVGELQSEAVTLSESKPKGSGSTAGALHRSWINLKSAIAKRDDHAILDECERGEDSAVHEYEEALGDKDLIGPVRQVISRQFEKVKSAHDRIKNLRDATAS